MKKINYWSEEEVLTPKKTINEIKTVKFGNSSYIFNADNIDVLRLMPDNCIDSVSADGPYGISFMNQKWDYDVPTVEFWKEVFRVVKPGGYVLSFASAKTYHRMATRIEDAGFEIRDQIMWIYGSGMPKSLNLALSIDKSLGLPNRGHRIAVASRYHPDGTLEPNGEHIPVYEARTEESLKWDGWGTNLKPSHEPIVVARKPLSEKTHAKNILKWGTGGINIDKCRIPTDDFIGRKGNDNDLGIGILAQHDGRKTLPKRKRFDKESNPLGRFPANIMFATLPDENWAKYFYCPKASKKERNEGLEEFVNEKIEVLDEGLDNKTNVIKNTHPTVKPVKLMQYLINLVTPKNGVVLDPFLGSGSTTKACAKEGFNFIGIEQSNDYFNIAVKRTEFEFSKCNQINEKKSKNN